LCTGDANGTITVNGQGGTVNIGNLEYSIDGGSNWQTGNIFTSLTAGDYRIQVRDENGCISDTLIPVIPADTFYIVDITADTNIVYLDSMELLVELNDTNSVMYSWSSLSNGGTLLTDSSYSYFVAPIDAEQYEFVATNRFGCEVSHVVNVEVDKPRPASAPNGFTPNGDGVNDRFFVQGGEKVEEVMVLRVFDRWGELVYDGSSMTVNDETTGWDGTFRGQDSPAGPYVWYAEVKFKDGHIEVIKGDVTLLR
jgi:gliding motility-associated-like protein